MTVFQCSSLLAASIAVFPLAGHHAQDNLDEAVGLYASRRFDEARQLILGQLANIRSPDETVRLVGRVDRAVGRADPWIGAAWALEVAEVLTGAPGTQRVPSPQFRVLEVGWRRVDNDQVPDPAALAWYRAAIALCQGPELNQSLPQLFSGDWPGGRFQCRRLIEHARRRYPNDPAVTLAWGLVNEQRLHWYAYTRSIFTGQPSFSTPQAVTGFDGRTAFSSLERGISVPIGFELSNASEAFEELLGASSPSERAKAALHLGTLRALRGHAADALRLWQMAQDTPSADLDTRYLALLFSGRQLWVLSSYEKAARALLQANELCPQAQSALSVLAGMLYTLGDSEQASAIAARSLAIGHDGNDPWHRYLGGEFEEWPALRSQMRTLVRR